MKSWAAADPHPALHSRPFAWFAGCNLRKNCAATALDAFPRLWI